MLNFNEEEEVDLIDDDFTFDTDDEEIEHDLDFNDLFEDEEDEDM